MKAGDYVRTTNGEIGKIIKCPEVLKKNYVNWLWFETADEQRPIRDEDIIKSSPNIIDLIEVGDIIINQLGEIIRPTSSNIDELKDYWKICENSIKSVVTKEQFEAMEYKLEVKDE